MTLGLGGFQETEQLPIFSKITKYQAHVNNRARMAELTARAFDRALLEMGPTQLNIPRDFFYGDIECEIPAPVDDRARRRRRAESRRRRRAARRGEVSGHPVRRRRGDGSAPADGAGRRLPTMPAAAIALAERLQAPVCNSYLHNDSFPASHPLWCGPLGYQGTKAAMKLIARADVVLALGTRLGPFGTLPQHGLDYWPKQAKVIQVDADAQDAGSGEAGRGGHLRRRRRGGAGPARPAGGPRAGRRRQSRGAARRRQGREVRVGVRARRLDPREGSLVGRGIERAPTRCTRDRCCANSNARCPRARWCPPTSATSARSRIRTFASSGPARCSRR